MGCISSSPQITIKTVNSNKNIRKKNICLLELRSNYKRNKQFFNKIQQSNWINIIDFLNFKELQEIGKTSKVFNYLVKQDKVLIKFFKKKNTNTKPASPQSNSTKANLFKIQTFAMLSNLDSQNSDDNNDSFCSTSLNTNSSLN